MMESTSKLSWGDSGVPEGMARPLATWLGLVLLLALVAGPAAAQVPQDIPFAGRLVDGAGTPLVEPVTFDLWIYGAATGGTAVYSERHGPVTLDAQGNFSVLLGTGTDFGGPFPAFDAALFSEVERYIEVVLILPTFQFLTPRVPLASVPWTLVAQQANAIVRDPGAPRFEDCGDGTVADHQTGLQWEKKTGTVGTAIICDTAGCPDPHVVNNVYQWSIAGTAANGGAFTDFLPMLKDPTLGEVALGGIYGSPAATGCFAGHCDWRLPIIDELRTILIGPGAAPGQATTCSVAPCIDPGFKDVGGVADAGGPTASGSYWSASTSALDPSDASLADFGAGNVSDGVKTSDAHVRAVRAGSCNP
jgi:hypothetical protein